MRKEHSGWCCMQRLCVFFLALLCCWESGFCDLSSASGEAQTVRVALYEGRPNLFTDASGNAAGFFADLLQEIASLEGWQLEYVPGTWAEGLERLQRGEVDLVTSLARTEEREKIYAYGDVAAFSAWTTAYVSPKSSIYSLLDLRGKRVVLLEGSVQHSGFCDFIRGFDLELTLVPVPKEQIGFAMVSGGEADAVLSVRTTGELYRSQYHLRETAVMFNAREAYYAAPFGDPKDLLSPLDAHLKRMKEDPGSAYYDIMYRWFPQEPQGFFLPFWVRMLLFGGLAVLLGSLVMVLLLRWQVQRRTEDLRKAKEAVERQNLRLQEEIKERERVQEVLQEHEAHLEDLVSERTRELRRINENLHQEIAERCQVEKKLSSKNEQLRRISDNLVEGFIYQVVLPPRGASRRFLYASAGVTAILGITPEELYADAGVMYTRIHSEDLQAFRDEEERVLKSMETFLREGRFSRSDGEIRWLRLSSIPHREEDGSIVWDGIAMDVTERKLGEERIREVGLCDALTGLRNRRYLEEKMEELDTPEALPLTVIMADSNGLKLVNDTYGHAVGDEMLCAIAAILKEVCEEKGILARWGGDEFVIFLPCTTFAEAGKISRTVFERCRSTLVREVPVSVSLGVAEKRSKEEKLLDILSSAEDEMYKRKLGESRSTRRGVVSALLKALGAKSHETEEHTRRMEMLALQIGERVGLPESELKRLSLVVILHDIGKIHVDEAILGKSGPLSPEEWEIVKKHPETGSRIARSTEEFAHVAEDILSHHERWDGTGYPRGLKGRNIPLLARITAVVDAYDVMTNGRPYKAPLSQAEALEECRRCSGTQFDPELVEIFLEISAPF